MPDIDLLAQAIIRAAVDVTAATQGWLVVPEADSLRIAAAAGEEPGRLIGTRLSMQQGTVAYVISSGQPLAISSRSAAERFHGGVGAVIGHEPDSVVCVPCTIDDEVVGALELVDKTTGGPFTFDDLELATVLAGIAGVALREVRASAPGPPTAGELAANLERLSNTDPSRFAAVATVISALLS